MLVFHTLFKFTQNYIMISICYGYSRTVQGNETSIDFITGSLYAGNLIPIISFLASGSCLSNWQNSATFLEPLNEPASLLERLDYPGLKRNSLPHRESLDRHGVLEVVDLDLEATGLETEPDSQASPGLKLEPDPTRAALDLGLDLLIPG